MDRLQLNPMNSAAFMPVESMTPLSPASQTPSTIHGANSPRLNDRGRIHGSDGTEGPAKKRQKRNKPTLSCEECVERKTKCDRGRPNCLACIKRQTECKYAQMTTILDVTNRVASNSRRMTKPPKSKTPATNSSLVENRFDGGKLARGSEAVSRGLLSNVPYSSPSASNVFGIGSEHPFANYWTCQGGLPEVISVLPEKIQADILLERYFDCVDPVYPMIHRQTFFADYEHFWSLSPHERNAADGALIALLFSMLALGTQFVASNSTRQTAEFYVSAAHQSLRMSSYLNKTSIRSIQAMVLITYFLINDNHASDGWAFAGILMRQAYAMGLHRDPNVIVPDASIFEKQQRRKVWQAVLIQDTFLTVLLSLPPSATHTDVDVAGLIDDTSSIASSHPVDTAYIRGCWSLANLVQDAICSPRSLDLPICTTARRKTQLLSDFKAVYRSFPDVFRCWDEDSIANWTGSNPRVVRQTLFLTSNYWHNVMLLQSSENSPEVMVNVRGTLEAAHEAIAAFFLFSKYLENESKVWWVFNHRAFLEALCIATILRDHGEGREAGGAPMEGARDSLFVRAKDDLVKMIAILQRMRTGDDISEVAKTRVAVLNQYL